MTKQIKLTHHFSDINALKSAWMPFVHEGGIFIPTEHVCHLGDAVEVSLTLLQDTKTYSFVAEVIWITPRSAHQIMGIGIQSRDIESEAFQTAVKNVVGAIPETDFTLSDTL